MAEARALRCPQCGAPVSPDVRACPYCATVLALTACPSCFGQIFVGAKHCSFCGAAAERTEASDGKARPCPSCRITLTPVAVGALRLLECGGCGGLWADVRAFERIASEREQQAAVLGAASPLPRPQAADGARRSERYRPCPECSRLMNRVNFARCSGVVVDVCKGHGTWFDHEELRRIVEFIRAGGLDRAREHERLDLEQERRRLRQQANPPAPSFPDSLMTGPKLQPLDYRDVLSAARELLKALFR